jgi:hypothetical protein
MLRARSVHGEAWSWRASLAVPAAGYFSRVVNLRTRATARRRRVRVSDDTAGGRASGKQIPTIATTRREPNTGGPNGTRIIGASIGARTRSMSSVTGSGNANATGDGARVILQRATRQSLLLPLHQALTGCCRWPWGILQRATRAWSKLLCCQRLSASTPASAHLAKRSLHRRSGLALLA